MNENKPINKKLIICIIILLLAFIALASTLIYDYIRGKQMDKVLQEMVDEFTKIAQELQIEEVDVVEGELEELPAEEVQEKINVSGYTVIGTITIDKIGIEYPILSESTDEALKVTVCKVAGNNVNSAGNLCIAGHNMRNGRMFTKIGDLTQGDSIKIKDSKLKTVEYKVTSKFVAEEDNTEILSQETNGKKIITLITCTNDNAKRVIIQAEAV